MKILFLAPQPFFQERGTPIAVRLAVQVLASRAGDSVDLLTYHEGVDVKIPNVALHRTPQPFGVRNVGPGISLKKLICDLAFAWSVFRMVRREHYDLVHAVEESVFIALLIKSLYGIPYLYDMDSSLALQVTEKWWPLYPLRPLLSWMEKLAMRHGVAVVPVCDALAAIALRHGCARTTVLSDISLLDPSTAGSVIDLRAEAHLEPGTLVSLYIGNLERYQGIDLMIEALAALRALAPAARHHLVVIGGRSEHIEAYRAKADQLGIAGEVTFLGPRPVSALNDYLCQANILLSPRVLGNNTPMKIYSYLHAGVPVLATRLSTHTQVLNDEVAVLAAPEPETFAQAWCTLVESEERRRAVGSAARALAESRYTFAHFERTLHSIYDRIAVDLRAGET